MTETRRENESFLAGFSFIIKVRKGALLYYQ
nr:MAG TPA: hypothetical protein [Caudoviricetes sp.]DAU77845.1 MAG TPA: hypothetical protein [Ackermannviridae sp.]